MDYRQLNKTVMDDTQKLCSSLDTLKNSIDNSIKNEYIVLQEDAFDAGSVEPNPNMRIIVSKRRTFEAAEAYKGKKICCLDFANNHNVGGAPWSAGAQEESICRISTLYPCLYAKKKDFYEKHHAEFVSGKIGDMGSDDLIYIPDVTVFKTDESAPKLKEEATWFNTDVIACAAPVLDLNYDKQYYKALMTKRIKRILDVAAKEKVEALILGAFGCGAFSNPPDVVSDIFASLIRNYNFETVEFAVYCRGNTTNFDVFHTRFFGSYYSF